MPLSHPLSKPPAGTLLALCLLSLATLPAGAQDTAPASEIELLRQQVEDLQARVSRLEDEIEQGMPVNVARSVEPVPGGWRKMTNWKRLAGGMDGHTVTRFLGEPDRKKTVKKFEFWYYGDGKASLYLGRLSDWDIPSGIDAE
jgi:hypothetical protein